jgi:RNase P/RNase MRP subunit POP5
MKTKFKPSQRLRRRYLLIKGNKKDVEKAILDYIGVLGWAKASPLFVKWKEKGKVVLAVSRKELDNIRASFEINKEKIEVLKVSGTLDGLSK